MKYIHTCIYFMTTGVQSTLDPSAETFLCWSNVLAQVEEGTGRCV